LIELSEQRLNEVGNDLNAVASSRIEKAKLEAKQLTNYEGAFSGIPFYLKGISQSLKGEPLEGGATLLKGVVAEETSSFSKMLLDAGLLCLGHSTTPELALKNITEPELLGPTRNPWNYDYSPGGSSGGAAALVASGVVPVAGASVGGGSIGIAVSFTSLIRFKSNSEILADEPGICIPSI